MVSMDDLAERFEKWLWNIPAYERAAIRSLAPVTGGASNLTYRVDLENAPCAGVALRIQRDGGIFQPYDVLREAQVLQHLAASPIPVPRVVQTEHATLALGAPFVVLEWIDAPHMGEAGPEADFGAFTAMVAAIHSLDWRTLGLGFLGVPASPAQATAKELSTVEARMRSFGLASQPLLARALDVLQAAIPEDGELSLCQGDINVFNYLFRERRVVGVVDWEQAHIGDCRSDVGQLVALSHLKGAPLGPAAATPFAAGYQAASGRPLANLEFFRAFWLFQLGVIYHGWIALNDSEPWYSWDHLSGLLEAALAEVA
jgi:aminoglycoside phosphotransferase (APT) family kinase protein